MVVKKMGVEKIFDSRGEPTIEVSLANPAGRRFYAQVPSGKSRGRGEAAVLAPEAARRVAEKVLKGKLRGRRFDSIRKLDEFLLKLDGTEDKRKIGGNLALGVSLAMARGLAEERGRELWQVLRGEFFKKHADKPPLIFSNLINGGEHAWNNLDIQEYMVVVKAGQRIDTGVERLISFYKNLGLLLASKYRLRNVPLGDEGGYSLDFKDNFEPIHILSGLIKKFRLRKEFSVALDAAASGFLKSGGYRFGGKIISSGVLLKIYGRWLKSCRELVSIEDPFAEGDHAGFARLAASAKGRLVVGDDLTVTNPALVEKFAAERLISAVIIKPNQIGTVSEACDAINAAHASHLKCIVSHRSGETADNFLVHFARAAGAFGVKIGAPARERLVKFDELIRIYRN